MLKNKKSEAGLLIVLIIIIGIFFIVWIININQRECNRNKDCSSAEYCGSDFSCHEYPTIQKAPEYSFVVPSIIIGIAIVAAAMIFRRNKPSSSLNEGHVHYVQAAPNQITAASMTDAGTTDLSAADVKPPQEVDEITDPYYKSKTDLKVP